MMKYFIILSAFFFTKTSQAQTTEIPNTKGRIDNIKIVNLNSFGSNLPQAKLLSITDKGSIYALPQDNMPCLVPDKKLLVENDHYKQFYLPNSIPNPYPKSNIIPSQPNGTYLMISPLVK